MRIKGRVATQGRRVALRGAVFVLALLLGAVIVVALGALAPPWIYERLAGEPLTAAELTPEGFLERTTATIAATGGFLVAYFTLVRTWVLDRQTRNQAAEIELRSEQHREDAHARAKEHGTERYSRAIDQIGSEAEGIRIGGLYALERLAKDLPEEWAEIVYYGLVSFLKTRTAANPSGAAAAAQAGFESDASRGVRAQSLPWAAERDRQTFPTPPPLGEDSHAALGVLARSRSTFDAHVPKLAEDNADRSARSRERGAFGVHFVDEDFSGRDFTGANFKAASITRSKFDRCLLRNATFERADLHASSFDGADIDGTSFLGALLTSPSFFEARLRGGVGFYGADVSDARFERALLARRVTFEKAAVTQSSFHEAQLTDVVDFRDAHLREVSFYKAHLGGVSFEDSTLGNVSFHSATLMSVMFSEATIDKGSFDGADVSVTLFLGTRLREASFVNAELAKVNFDGATFSGRLRVAAEGPVIGQLVDGGAHLSEATVEEVSGSTAGS